MLDLDPEVLKKMKSMGLLTDEQEAQQKADRKKKEAQEEQARKKKLAQQERNMGQRSRGGGFGGGGFRDNRGDRGGRNIRQVTAQQVHGIYGKVRQVPPATKPLEVATAPYNFIPLPDGILPSPLNDAIGNILQEADGNEKAMLDKTEKKALRQEFRRYLSEGEHYSGTIRLEIENLTPIFIGGNKDSAESFAPAGKAIIPGSELRGMVKNLFKMVTCGGWKAGEDMVNRHLYYRCMMASKSDAPQNQELCAHYTNYMTTTDKDGKVRKNARPGFLVKRKSGYVIYPLLEGKLHSIPIRSYMDKYHLYDKDVRKSAVHWDGQTVYIRVGLLSTKKLRTKEQIDKSTGEDRKRWGKQYYKYMSIDDIDKSKCYEVPSEIVEEYRDDKNRRGMDLIKRSPEKGTAPKHIEGLESYQSIIPCFFFLEEGSERVKSFGHGQSYRIPYDHSTMDAVNGELRKGTVDFAAAVFGQSSKAASWASRVAFEDAVPEKSMGTCGKAKAHALMQPNPTSFQLYLQQNDKDKLLFWDSAGAKARGYKLYWHSKDGHDWRASDTEQANLENDRAANAVELLKEINPLKAGARFKGQVRFWDLTRTELGALLRVFYLAKDGEEDIAYKIGMGKSIGLGSIRMVPTLCLEDGSRYQSLFDASGWHTSQKETDPQEFLSAYEDYVREAVDGKLWDSYQSTLKDMRLMMDYRNVSSIKEWEAATSPMDGNTKERDPQKMDNRFQRRSVLPGVREVIEKAKKGL